MSKFGIPLTTIALGLALVGLGMLSHYLAGTEASTTALIPSFVGGGFLIIGGISFSPKLRKHAIHGALLLALLLGAMTLYMGIKELFKPAEESSARKLFAFETTAVLCISYIVIGVRSFIHARKLRKQADKAMKKAEKAAPQAPADPAAPAEG
ncbi:MAG: hypothetical protein AAGA25_02195 [Planctomycetota bacterium]